MLFILVFVVDTSCEDEFFVVLCGVESLTAYRKDIHMYFASVGGGGGDVLVIIYPVLVYAHIVLFLLFLQHTRMVYAQRHLLS